VSKTAWEAKTLDPEVTVFISSPWELWHFRRKANVSFRNAGWVRRSRLPGFVKSIGRPKKKVSL
jgi:hypothetical protein